MSPSARPGPTRIRADRRWNWRRGASRWAALALLAAGLQAMAVAAPREVRVGIYANAPKIFIGKDGQPSGILGDLLQAIAQRENWQLRPVPCEWQACLDALQTGRIDLLPDVAYTEQRAQVFDFHGTPALLSWSQLYRPKGIPIRSMLDLQGKRIAVVEGSVQAPFLQSMLESFGVRAEFVAVKSFEQGFELAAARQVDAVAANRFYGDLQAQKYQLESTAIVFQPAQLYYATARGRHPELLRAIDRHLSQWQAQSDSPYAKALQHWLQAPARFAMPAYLWWTLPALFGLLLLAVLAAGWLRRQVRQQTAHLRASEDRLNTILNSVDALIYIKDTELRYQYANSKVCAALGRPLAQVVGQNDQAFFDAGTAAQLRANDIRVIAHGERVEEEEVLPSADGATAHNYLSVKLPLRHPDGRIYALCGIATDITRRKQTEEAIHQLAFYDALTQLPNRRLLQDRIQQLLAAFKRNHHCAALLFIDVDNFKDVNDTLGHDVGDALLRQMATRMAECIRAQDTLARQGGDEFMVMLIDLSANPVEAAAQAQQVAHKILTRLGETYRLDDQTIHSNVSIGVTMIDDPQHSRDELFKQADMAMYQAKADGRNALRFFNPAMQAQVIARTTLEADLRWALNAQEFILLYQPQVDRDGQTRGYEALVRWQHPMRGAVLPRNFIPAAEACGVILPLGRWILQEACRQLVEWAHEPAHCRWTIAVNVSAKQFRQSDFVAQVQTVLRASGANPMLLELELTEGQLVEDVESVIAKMVALKALGVRLSLDDFGTGYSSLSMLKRLPLDQLKIDQCFVRDMLTEAQDASIIRAILTLGSSLSLDVIAEGVELPEQHAALLTLGCQHFQGYLYGQPSALIP